jgi:hypothetical protein
VLLVVMVQVERPVMAVMELHQVLADHQLPMLAVAVLLVDTLLLTELAALAAVVLVYITAQAVQAQQTRVAVVVQELLEAVAVRVS